MEIKKKVSIVSIEQIVSVDLSSYNKSIYCYIEGANLKAPEVKQVLHNAVRLRFDSRHLNRDLTIVFVIDEETRKNKIAKALTKRIALGVIYMLLSTCVGFLANVAYKKLYLQDASLWQSEKTKSKKKVKYNNDRAFYDSDSIKELEQKYRENFNLSNKFTFKDIFQHKGDGVYLMRDVVRHADGEHVLLNKDDAEDFCKAYFNGRLLMSHEYDDHIILSFKDSLTSPFKSALKIPEWTLDQYEKDSDYFKILVKKGKIKDMDIKIDNGFVYGEETRVIVGFRCAMEEED
jgi:hypothetical protein